MNHEELAARLEHRLDKIEDKLDKHLVINASQEADLKWIKGYIRFSIVALISLGGTVATTLFKLFSK